MRPVLTYHGVCPDRLIITALSMTHIIPNVIVHKASIYVYVSRRTDIGRISIVYCFEMSPQLYISL